MVLAGLLNADLLLLLGMTLISKFQSQQATEQQRVFGFGLAHVGFGC